MTKDEIKAHILDMLVETSKGYDEKDAVIAGAEMWQNFIKLGVDLNLCHQALIEILIEYPPGTEFVSLSSKSLGKLIDKMH